MHQKKSTRANSKDIYLSEPLIVLGNSSKEQLKSEAKQWIKEAQKESKSWGKIFAL
ncbi:MAG: hypothetical protein K9L79_01345 [Methylobacter tundripaludum]|nr:hypothetical protein [Methylobacter tundripaludum]